MGRHRAEIFKRSDARPQPARPKSSAHEGKLDGNPEANPDRTDMTVPHLFGDPSLALYGYRGQVA